MIRRSRINVRPCVKAPLRTGAPSLPKDSTKPNVETIEGQGDEKDSTAVAAVVANTDQGEPNDQTGEGPVISTAVQRRKRFSFKPRVAPGLTRTSAPATATPVKAVSEPLVQVPVSDIDQPVPSCQSESVVSLGLKSPSRRRPSGESRHPETQPNATPPTLTPSTPQTVPEAENPLELAHFPDEQDKNKECPPVNQTKEVPPKPPDEHSPSLPDKEAIEISERAKTLMSRSTGMGLSKPPHTSLNRLLNDPADVQRLKKARKLRELLKQEICKEKKHKKDKARAKEYVTDPAIMTLRELIYYMPMSNPMTSYIEDSLCANETEVPPVSVKDKTPQRPQEPVINHEMEDLEEEEEMEANDEQAEPMVVPRVKVAEDGSLIIDEESLTVEVKRAKGPNPIEDRDPIFERGSTTTYSSFRKGSYAKPWSDEETDMFFLAVSMVGTDFSMIGQLFPHRTRSEIKNKFKKEERANAWRIDKACRQRSKFDVESFSKLLQKMMEVKNSRTKKPKSPSETTATKRTRRKAKGKKAVRELSDLEEEENGSSDLEEVSGETVNEDICNKEGPPVSKSKRKSRRKPEDQASPEQPEEKKTKTDHITSEQDTQGEASLPEDAEAVLPEDHSTLDSPENSESVKSAKGTMNKPARLSRTKTPKLPLPLGRKLGKKGPRPSVKVKDATPDPLKENTREEASKEPVDGNASLVGPTKQKKPDNDNSSESEGETLVTPPKPTRYGRMPKPIQPLNYSPKEDAHSSLSEATCDPASPVASPTTAVKPKPRQPPRKARSSKTHSIQESKKPKLVTLRSSQSEYDDDDSHDDDDDETQREAEEVEEQRHPSSPKESSAFAFVPASLRSPQPVVSEVEETLAELDILTHIPDVLGIPQDALCPDASCEQAQDESGTASCEHHLDLHVDVKDFLSADQMEASEKDSYNEAAQTLLTIGNVTHLSQTSQNQQVTQDHGSGSSSVSVHETSSQRDKIFIEAVAQCSQTPPDTVISGPSVTESMENVETGTESLETESLETVDTAGQDNAKPSAPQSQKEEKMEPASQIDSTPEVLEQSHQRAKRPFLSKVKPKPNIGRSTRTAKSKSLLKTPVSLDEKSSKDLPEFSGATQSLSKESLSLTDNIPESLTDDMDRSDVKVAEESSGCQDNIADTKIASDTDLGSETPQPSAPQNKGDCLSTLVSLSTDETLTSCPATIENPASSTSEPLSTENTVAHSEPQPICNTIADKKSPLDTSSASSSVPFKMCSSLASTENQSTCEKVDVLISCLNSSSEGAESNVSPKRRRISKIKPNVGFPSRNTQSKSQLTEDSSNLSKSESMNSSSSTSSEQHSTKDNNTCELNTIQKADMHLTSPHSSSNTERVNLAQPKAIESEIPFEANTTPDTRTSDPVVTETCAIEDSFTVTKSVHETQSSDTSVIGGTVTGNTSAIEAKDTETVPHLPVESSVMQKNIQTQRRCFSKVKPKPNLCQAIRNKKPNPCPTKDTMRKSNPEVLERTSEICPEKQKNEEPGVHSDPQIGKDYSMPAIPTQSPSSSEQSSSVVPSAASGLHSSESNFCPSIMKNSAISETLMAIEDQFVMRDYDLLPQNSNEFTEIKPSDKPTTMEDNIKGLEQPALHVVEVSKETLPHQTTWGRFSKAKPRLQHKPAIRTTQPQPIEDTHLHEEPEPCQTESQPSLGTDTTESSDKKEQHSTIRPVPSPEHQFPKSTDEVHTLSDDSEKLSGGISCRTMSSDHINEVSWLIENPFLMIDTNDSQMSTTAPAPAGQPSSTQDKVEAESTPLELKSQATDGPNPISKSMSLIGDSLQSKLQPLLNTNAYSTADPKESSQHLCLESSSDIVMVDIHVKDHDDLQHLPESSETNQTATDNSQDAHIGDDVLLQPLDSNPSAKKAPPARRARLSRPKPNLRCSSQLSHRKPVQTATQPEPVSATCSEAQEEAASQRPDSTPDANSPGPVNAATIGCVEIDNPSNSAAIALDCMIEMPSISIQDAAAEDSGCSESIPVLTGHSDVLSEEVPPNPEEPFFILSLTEIPVFPSGEEMESVSEPIPYLPATDETVQLQSSGLATPEGSSNVGEDQALCDVLVPMPTEEADERGFSSVNEVEPAITTCKSSTLTKPEDLDEHVTPQSSQLSEAEEDSAEICPPHRKKAKLQTEEGGPIFEAAELLVNCETSQEKQSCRTLTSEESRPGPAHTNTTLESELPLLSAEPEPCPSAEPEPCPSAEPEICPSAEPETCPSAEPETCPSAKPETGASAAEHNVLPPTGREGAEVSSFRAESQTSHPITAPPVAVSLNRKPRGFLCFLSDKSKAGPPGGSQQAKTASQGPCVKTARRKRAVVGPVTSKTAPLDATPTPSAAAVLEDTPSTSTTTAPPEVAVTETLNDSPVCPDPVCSTSNPAAEVPTTEQNETQISPINEEPTNVSQYFLSDIFTEVEEE